MDNFIGFNLPSSLSASLEQMGYQTPTPIQQRAIPLALEGHDILGSAQTGTGKTAAFGVPLVAHLLMCPKSRALVMTPTRELAVQVIGILQQLVSLPESGRDKRNPGEKGYRYGEYSRKKQRGRVFSHENQKQTSSTVLKTALLIGGESMTAQLHQLRWHPRIIVGTPGRINDHLSRGTLDARDFDFCVLDETDRMLDMGFMPQLDKIIQNLAPVRQTLMFSATFPRNIMQLAAKYLKEPVKIEVGDQNTVVKSVKQESLQIPSAKKYGVLSEELIKREGSVLVFVKTKCGADKLAAKLVKDQHEAAAIHGDLRQRDRAAVIRAFREQRYRILVATDIVARGLDIPHIEHVINYDLPQTPEDYIHRIGRTGRAGAAGSSLCLISPEDRVKWRTIERLLSPKGKTLSYVRSTSFDKRRERSMAFRRRFKETNVVFTGHGEHLKKQEYFEAEERSLKASRKPLWEKSAKSKDLEANQEKSFTKIKVRKANRENWTTEDRRSSWASSKEDKLFREGSLRKSNRKRVVSAFKEKKLGRSRSMMKSKKPLPGGRRNISVAGRQ